MICVRANLGCTLTQFEYNCFFARNSVKMIMITHPILGTGRHSASREKSNDKGPSRGDAHSTPGPSHFRFPVRADAQRGRPTQPLIAPPSAEVRVAIVATAVLYLRFVIRAGIPYSY
jgi:hypothetical protein